MKHPMQPLITDKDGALRFQQNAIVRYLLNAGPFDMNQLAVLPFSDEDRVQFAQLIGYSLCGFGDLSYVSDEAYAAAEALAALTGDSKPGWPYEYINLWEEEFWHLQAELHSGGYLVYRRAFDTDKCTLADGAKAHKEAMFVCESMAVEYCAHRNAMTMLHGTDDVTVIQHP